MENSRIVYLVTGYLNNTLTGLEIDELQLILLNEEESETVAAAFREIMLQMPVDMGYQADQWESLADRILAQSTVETPVITMQPGGKRRIYWAAAAVVMAVIIAGTWYATRNRLETITLAKTEPEEIQPGMQGALLTLADGSQVLLDTIQNGVVALQGGATAKVVNGALIYEGKGEAVYNTMSTPKGRQFQMTLPDGTQVWLNAASTIRYPTVFTGNERRVEVSGETYFEVARNSRMPFRVSVNNGADIEVLGTHFNINSYSNENSVNATLLQGSIRVKKGDEAVVIKPGEQARMQSSIRVEKEVDLEQVVAWKNGLFNFNGLKLEEVMRQIERWYGIEVVYEKGIPKIPVVGEMSKDIPLNGLMIVLEKLDIHYRLEGRKLIILP
ncbi:MAG: FecR family protein [Pseudobacter sp.]|uniref:FecR family protein n=1 Tax=Pseudobacter sp. TaxID=2045420 RepID=UPI003F7DEE67